MVVVNALAKEMARIGLTTGAMAISPTNSLLSDSESWPDVSVLEPVALTGRGDMSSMARVFGLGRRMKARVVLVHTHRHATPLALGRLSSGQPLNMVSVEHHSLGLRSTIDNVNSFSALLWSKASVFLTAEYLQGYPLKSLALPGLKTATVIGNGIDFAPFLSRRRCVQPSGTGNTGPILGMATRLVPSKDIETILEVIAMARNAHEPRVPHLRLAGDGPERQRLEARVSELGIGEFVTFLGQLREDQLPEFFSTLDIYVLSTRGETLNTSLIQAAASRVPIVASRVSGITNVFTDGVTAILFEPSSPSSLASAIQMASETGVVERIVEAAFELAQLNFTSEMMTRGYLDLLTRIDPAGPWLAAQMRMEGG
jgi:glycosyltransferase involved in cell wall biosynthesis